MKLFPADLAAIQEGAASLAERLSGGFAPKDDPRGEGERRLSLWQQAAGTDDVWRLASALGSCRIAHPALPPLLGPMRLPDGARLPPWAAFVAEIVEVIASASARTDGLGGGRSGRGGPMTRIPFWQLYRPIAQLARSRVADRNPTGAGLLAERAWEDLQRMLMQRLSTVASTALHTKFLAHRAFTLSGMASLFAAQDHAERSRPPTPEDQAHYARFIREEAHDGLRLFFLRYPVAARLLAEVTLSWMEVVEELLTRCQEDWRELSHRFNRSVPSDKIARMSGGLSDPHHGGRTVLALTFASGLRLVYKPRSLQTDILFFQLVKKLNTLSPAVPLRTLEVLDRGEYGWVEFAPHSPCASKAALGRFYFRAGSLAALSHGLQAIDCHRENLVAAGEQPVLIDLETIAHPFSREEIAFVLEHGANALAHSPLRTGLLPLWQAPFGKEVFYDNSALGASIAKRDLFPTVRWRNLDTDQLTWESVVQTRSHRAHRPCLLDRVPAPRPFAREIQRGYHAMAKLLDGAAKQSLLRCKEAITATARRRVKRPTPIYSLLLRESLQSERLTSGVLRSIGLQALPCSPGDESEWAAEIASLECLDVPYFTFPGTDHGSLTLGQPDFGRATIFAQAEQIGLAIKGRLVLENGRIRRL